MTTTTPAAAFEAVRISAGGIREYVHQAFVWLAVGGAIGLYAGHQIWAGPNLTPAATKLDIDLHVDGDLTLRGNPFPPGPNPGPTPPGPNPGPNPTPIPPSPIDPNKPWLPPGPRPDPPTPTPIELKPTVTTPVDEWRNLPGYPGFEGYGHEENGQFYARKWRQETMKP